MQFCSLNGQNFSDYLCFFEKVTTVSLCLRIEYCQSCQFQSFCGEDEGFCGEDKEFLAKMKDFLLFLHLCQKTLHLCHTVCNVYLAY